MKERRIAQFVHIEKTAGTSVRYSVEQAVGSENVYVYSPESDRLTKSSEGLKPVTSPLLDRLRLGFSNPVLGPLFMLAYPRISARYKDRIRKSAPALEVPTDAKVVFGHFAADRFDSLLPEGTTVIRAVVLREPLERMRSHYDHWKRTRANEDWRVHIPYSNLSFEQFSLLPEMQNYQSQALAGKELSDFDIVGTADRTEAFTETFIKALIGVGLISHSQEVSVEHKRYNRTPEKRRTLLEGLDQTFLEAFSVFHQQDYKLYSQALEMQAV
jgi:hypothetical protein